MIELYTWTTPNGQKASVMLEECGLEYSVHPVNLREGEQHAPDFRKISPNGRIPGIVDTEMDGGRHTVFESGAILVYLAEKCGKFLPTSEPARSKCLEWLFWQMAGVGPMLGQANYFINTAEEQIPYAIDRYVSESARLINVMDGRLGEAEYLGGEYSIADIATYPWVAVAFDLIKQAKPEIVGEGAHTKRWLDAIAARPAVQKGMAVPDLAD